MRALLEELVGHVYRFAVRLTGDPHAAEDLTQDALLRAWRHARHLRDARKARVWLFKITVNLWRDQLRKQKRRPNRADVSPEECEALTLRPDRALSDREDAERALKTIDLLPSRQRRVLYLHACEELSVAQIAEVLEISPQAVKASLSLARKRMRRLLADMCRDRFPTR